ncbi:VWA domain-containing protein [Subsaximicrobium wynnwilliamsii]|uniref:VWA domain-containing protein n=1 Tax=Subsaximicrobium wynnwilliamsii TaxID=291179 RepID=A0A5C6ZF03_9FLAO|nr:vWA domain-containing protein [Subsaximicrobium wynnwilliamsii]TXD82129.1 VWA domain-containing protein [Subsaximicrobium wynnwilliamsii]TXD87774.1 VWA domain-containing protein [Subsaximicrobium wynnwilliamsii]TXE01585.1 VWA domain-containing protein [Subsaximicrobium wynnwilliamsii]
MGIKAKAGQKNNACEAHIALAIDESGSISGSEIDQIKMGLKNFIASQLNNDNRISLVGMSNSDNDLRSDNIINQFVNDSTKSTFDNWILGFRSRSGAGIGSSSAHWSSALETIQSLQNPPDVVIIITDGLLVDTPAKLQNRIATVNSNSHIFVYGIDEINSYPNGNSLSQTLDFYLGRPAILSTDNSDILTTDYVTIPDFSGLENALSDLSQTLINSNIGCGNLDLISENITIGKLSLNCSNDDLNVGTITISSQKAVPYVIEADTQIANINGLIFSCAIATEIAPNGSGTIVPVKVNGTPFSVGFQEELIAIETVNNPENLKIEFCVVDRQTIKNGEVSAFIKSEYEYFLNLLCLLKQSKSDEEKGYTRNTLILQARNILRKLEETKPCGNITTVQEICWMTLENHEFNSTIPGQAEVEQEQKDMVAAVQKTVQPIWRPNTKYYMRFRLKDEVNNGEFEEQNKGLFDYYYGFKTVGPVGHYHKDSTVDYIPTDANPDQYPLTSLRQYIDYNRSYPNADGNLLQAKPLFYGNNQCKITVYFSKPFTYHMLNKWHSYEDSDSGNSLPELAGSMHIAIKDPVTDVIIPYPLPANFSQETVPTGQTFATWIEFNSQEELEFNECIRLIDVNDNPIGEYSILKKDYLIASDTYRLRIDDEAVLSDNSDLISGKIKWESLAADNPTVVYEFDIVAIGSEDANWNIDNNPRIPMNLQLLNNMVEYINQNNSAINCDLEIGEPILPNSYAYTVTLTNLKPRKLYTALLYNAFDKNNSGSLQDTESEEVHQFVFQTSRYKNFEEQVNSYWLRELDSDGIVVNEQQAVFIIPLSLSVDEIETAYNIVAGISDINSENLESQYYHLFDRATEGVLGISPFNPPENTEFNVLKNLNTGQTFGILIRNPEPFNIPKIPLDTIEDTVKVVFASSGNPNNTYKVLHSKDYSQVLIMHDSREITVDTLNFKFSYKIWNGSEYITSSDVVIDNILINIEN